MSSVSRSRSSNRTCSFPASGFRTRVPALLHTVKPGFTFAQAVKRLLYLPRIYQVARPLANHCSSCYVQRCPRTKVPSLHDHYSFQHYYGPFRHPSRPGLSLAGFPLRSRSAPARASHVDAFLLRTHVDATTPAAWLCAGVAHFQSQLRSSPSLSGLDAHIAFFEACSTFIHISTCVLADPPTGPLAPEASTAAVTSSDLSGCFRLEQQLPGGLSSSHWSNAPLSWRTERTSASLRAVTWR
jgi:hypothetical protein